MEYLHLECLPDETIAKSLGVSRKSIKHHNDKGRVCNFLMKNPATSLIGMIDEDPSSAQPSYLSTLIFQKEEHHIKILQDTVGKHKIIIICPRLEDWLINTCVSNNIDMADFNLSDRSNTLHRDINSNLEKVTRLVNHLVEKRIPSILFLKNHLI